MEEYTSKCYIWYISNLFRNGQMIWLDIGPKGYMNDHYAHEKHSQQFSLGKMQIKPQWNTASQPLGWLKITVTDNNNYWWGRRGMDVLVPCCSECKMVQPVWKTIWHFFDKLNIELSCCLANPFQDTGKLVFSRDFVCLFVESGFPWWPLLS